MLSILLQLYCGVFHLEEKKIVHFGEKKNILSKKRNATCEKI